MILCIMFICVFLPVNFELVERIADEMTTLYCIAAHVEGSDAHCSWLNRARPPLYIQNVVVVIEFVE